MTVKKPMHVRNFWVELEVDGKKDKIASGPKNKGGGFYLKVRMRDHGEIIEPCTIQGRADEDGKLNLIVYFEGEDWALPVHIRDGVARFRSQR